MGAKPNLYSHRFFRRQLLRNPSWQLAEVDGSCGEGAIGKPIDRSFLIITGTGMALMHRD